MKRIRVSTLAEPDPDEIWYETARRSGSIAIAAGVVDSIERGTRSFPVENYIIYYRQNARHLVVSRVIHGMRDQKGGVLPRRDVTETEAVRVSAASIRPISADRVVSARAFT